MKDTTKRPGKSRIVRGAKQPLPWIPPFEVSLASTCLMAAIIIYAVCLLLSEPFGYNEGQGTLLVRQASHLALDLIIALACSVFVAKGLSGNAKETHRGIAVGLLVLPVILPTIDAIAGSASVFADAWWFGIAFAPALFSFVAYYVFLSREDARISALVIFTVICSFVASQIPLISPGRYDFVEAFFLEVVAVGIGLLAYAHWRKPRWWKIAIALLAGLIVAAAFAVVTDGRFCEVLDDLGYVSVYLADRAESLRRFLTFDLAGWDAMPSRNCLLAVAKAGGAATAVVYVVLLLASAVLMALRVSKMVRCRTDNSTESSDDWSLSSLALCGCGVAYSALIVIGIAAGLLNINTAIEPVSVLGVVPLSLMVLICVLDRSNFKESIVIEKSE